MHTWKGMKKWRVVCMQTSFMASKHGHWPDSDKPSPIAAYLQPQLYCRRHWSEPRQRGRDQTHRQLSPWMECWSREFIQDILLPGEDKRTGIVGLMSNDCGLPAFLGVRFSGKIVFSLFIQFFLFKQFESLKCRVSY